MPPFPEACGLGQHQFTLTVELPTQLTAALPICTSLPHDFLLQYSPGSPALLIFQNKANQPTHSVPQLSPLYEHFSSPHPTPAPADINQKQGMGLG